MPLLLHRSPAAGRALAWRSRRHDATMSPGPGPLAAVRHLFRDHSGDSQGVTGGGVRNRHTDHKPPQTHHRHPHQRKGAELSTDWPTLYLGAKLAYWSGLCYFPYDTIPRTLQEEGLQLVAYGRTNFTCWYVADGSVDFEVLRSRALPPRPSQHPHPLAQHTGAARPASGQASEAPPHGSGAPLSTGSETLAPADADGSRVIDGDQVPSAPYTAGTASVGTGSRGRGEEQQRGDKALGGAGEDTDGDMRASSGLAHHHRHHHHARHGPPSHHLPSLPGDAQAASSTAPIQATAGSTTEAGQPDTHGGGHHRHPHRHSHQADLGSDGRPASSSRNGPHQIHLHALEQHPPLHLRPPPRAGGDPGRPTPRLSGQGAAEGASAAAPGSDGVVGSAPVVPGTRCRFIFLRGVQWAAPDVNTLSLSASLATFWPTPLQQPAEGAAAASPTSATSVSSSPPASASPPTAAMPVSGSSGGPGRSAAPDTDQLVAHSGVAALARELLPVLLPHIRDAASAGVEHVVFAGHSLGGSLAKLLWAMSLMQGHISPQASSCHTFGSPPVLAHTAGGGGARVLRVLRAPPASAVNWVLEHDPVPRAMLTADPYFAAARAAVPGLSALLALRGAVLGEGAALSSGRFLYETVGELLLLRWASRGGCEVVPVSEPEADSLLKMALDGAVAAPVRTLQYWLDHHHASYHHDLEAAALATCRLQARRARQLQHGHPHPHGHHHNDPQRQ